LKISLSDLETKTNPKIVQAIEKTRIGDIILEPGFDGVFGKIKIWLDGEEKAKEEVLKEQMTLFG